jgi:peroxiredoxin
VPFCNAHLAALAEAEKKLLELGYQIIAISPDAPASLRLRMIKKINLLLSDSTGELSKSVVLLFKLRKL